MTRLAAAVACIALLGAACGSGHSATNHGSSTARPPGASSTGGGSTSSSQPPPVIRPAVQQLNALHARSGDALGGSIWYDTFKSPVQRIDLGLPGEAAMSDDGTVAVVGAPGAAGGPHAAKGAGTVYVFARSSRWIQAAALTAPDGAAYDGFGTVVAISGDGHDVLVGAPYADRGAAIDEGAAYAFHAVNGVWHVAELHAKDGAAYDNFGWSVGFSDNGLEALVGAPAHSVGGVKNAGAAYEFTRPSSLGPWTQRSALHAGRPTDHADFGASVALSDDGAQALVTQVSHFDAHHRAHVGAAYVFGRVSASRGAWRQLASFPDSGHDAGSRVDDFGIAAAMSGDGHVIAISSPSQTVGGRRSVGYIDVYATTGAWTDANALSKLTLGPAQPQEFLYYGSSLALSRDGRRLLVGIDGGGLDDQGALELVTLTGGTPSLMLHDGHRTEVVAPNAYTGRLGQAVALSANGDTVLATAPAVTVGKAAGSGAAFVFLWPLGAAA